jgi:glycosyltransferase involved in cell wall biosynthesis
MLSIVLPCYNERDNIHALINRLDEVAARHSDLEILLVDNGSTDDSAAVFVQELSGRNRDVFKVVTVEKNIGYGFGILSGLRAANGDVLAVTHADRQTDPLDVLRALEEYELEQNDLLMVKGARKNRKASEAIFSYGMGLLASLVLGKRLTEINAQPKLFSRRFFEMVEKEAPNDFALDTYLLFKAKELGDVREIPVFFAKRVAGEAKGGSGSSWKVRWKLMKRCTGYIFELKNKLK